MVLDAMRVIGGRILCLALAFGLMLPAEGIADIVRLRNGQQLEGRILSRTEDRVVFQDMNRVVVTLRMEQIASIDEGMSALNLEEQGNRSFAERDYEEAIEYYNQAIERGAPRARIEPRLREARRAITMRDLGRHAEEIQAIRQAIDGGAIGEAEGRLNALALLDPEDVDLQQTVENLRCEVHYHRALAQLDTVDYAAAERQLRTALDLNPSHARAAMELARLMAQISRTREQGIFYYRQALRNAEGQLDEQEVLRCKNSLGELYYATGQFESAAQYLQEVHEANSTFRPGLEDQLISALEKLAAENELRNPERSVAAYRQAVAVRQFDNRLRSNLAKHLLAAGENDAAISEYLTLINAEPNFPGAYHNLAKAFLQTGEYDSARQYLRRAIEVNSSNYDAYVDYGDLLVRTGDIDQAREQYQIARRLEPTDPRATVSLAMAERLLGNYAEARKYVQEILAIRPEDPRTNLEMGMLGKDEKKFDEATQYLDRTIKLIEEGSEDTKFRYRELLANAFLARGEIKLLTRGPATATEDFNRALATYPDYPGAYFNIGAAYQKKFSSSKLIEDLQQAEQHMKRARELDPNNPEFAFGLGVLYHQVLASADSDRQQDYIRMALDNYQDYIARGGTEVSKVEGWIRELGGNL